MAFCPLSEIKSPRLHEFAAYLEGKREGDAAVKRANLDPLAEIPRLIAGALMIEKIRDGSPEVGMDVDLTAPLSELRTIFAGSAVFSGSRVLPWETRAHVVVEWVAARLDAGPDLNDLVMFVFDKQP